MTSKIRSTLDALYKDGYHTDFMRPLDEMETEIERLTSLVRVEERMRERLRAALTRITNECRWGSGFEKARNIALEALGSQSEERGNDNTSGG